MSVKVWGKVTHSRGLGFQSQCVTWSDSDDWASPVFPRASVPAGLVWDSLTPWSSLLLVFGMWVTLSGILLLSRQGKVPAVKCLFPWPPSMIHMPSPGASSLLTEIKGAWNCKCWMCALSPLWPSITGRAWVGLQRGKWQISSLRY